MQTYLVGGAVRDTLLGRPVKDRDFVVVGSTPKEMKAKGFKRVGGSFPVFLHPDTGEEYALARTERKNGRGHGGFKVQYDPKVTLEDDLKRRDLTINAMAFPYDEDHPFRYASQSYRIDPFGGEQDLEDGILRHVSDAFQDDPLRVLRVARFAARYGFTVAPETMRLMTKIVKSGEMETLTRERVLDEFYKAIGEQWPELFFEVLKKCGAFKKVFPMVEYANTFNVPQVHWKIQRVMVFFADSDLEKVKKAFRPSKEYMNGIEIYQLLSRAIHGSIGPQMALSLFKEIKDNQNFATAIHALYTLYGEQSKHRLSFLMKAFDRMSKISYKDLSEKQKADLKGRQIGEAIDKLRLRAVKEM